MGRVRARGGHRPNRRRVLRSAPRFPHSWGSGRLRTGEEPSRRRRATQILPASRHAGRVAGPGAVVRPSPASRRRGTRGGVCGAARRGRRAPRFGIARIARRVAPEPPGRCDPRAASVSFSRSSHPNRTDRTVGVTGEWACRPPSPVGGNAALGSPMARGGRHWAQSSTPHGPQPRTLVGVTRMTYPAGGSGIGGNSASGPM